MRLALAALIPAAAIALASRQPADAALRCTMRPGIVRLVGVVEDTTPLTVRRAPAELTSGSMVQPGAGDSLLVTDATTLPTAWVRVSHLDAATRASLTALGVTDQTPRVIVQARPYRADCRGVRWTEKEPWVVPSTAPLYFSDATLSPREYWHNDVPTFVVHGGWQSPYPRQLSGLAVGLTEFNPTGGLRLTRGLTRDSLAVAPDLFTFDTAMAGRPAPEQAMAWAREHLAIAEREPIKSMVRQHILQPEVREYRTKRSRYAGLYHVTMVLDRDTTRWHFRTDGSLIVAHREWNAERSTAELLAAPYSVGHTISGWGAPISDTLSATRPTLNVAPRRMAWLSVRDAIVAPDTSARSALRGELLFTLHVVPTAIWEALTPFYRVEPPLPANVRMPPRDPGTTQVLVPLLVERTQEGAVRGNATVRRGVRTLSVLLERTGD